MAFGIYEQHFRTILRLRAQYIVVPLLFHKRYIFHYNTLQFQYIFVVWLFLFWIKEECVILNDDDVICIFFCNIFF